MRFKDEGEREREREADEPEVSDLSVQGQTDERDLLTRSARKVQRKRKQKECLTV
jgi:hypothetical protein